MKQFGKIEDNMFILAPTALKDAKFTYFNPSEEKYKEFGYLEVETAIRPNDGIYTATYKLENNKIKQIWVKDETVYEQPKYAEQSVEDKIKVLEEQLAQLKEQIK